MEVGMNPCILLLQISYKLNSPFSCGEIICVVSSAEVVDLNRTKNDRGMMIMRIESFLRHDIYRSTPLSTSDRCITNYTWSWQ